MNSLKPQYYMNELVRIVSVSCNIWLQQSVGCQAVSSSDFGSHVPGFES